MDFLKIVGGLDPKAQQVVLSSYMGQDKLLFMAGYIIGMMVDAILLGVILHQFSHWWEYARKAEARAVRYIVYFCMVFSVGITVYLAVWIFHMFVYGFGDYTVFVEVSWLSWWMLADVVIRVPVQGFFAERAWRMTNRSWWFAVILGVSYFGAVGSGIAVKVILPQLDKTDLSKKLVFVWVGIEIGQDVIVTGTISYWLWTARTGFSGTDALLSRLLRMVLETQLPPTILAIGFLVALQIDTLGSSTRAFVFAPKVYVVCLLAVLNSRQSLRRDMSSDKGGGPAGHSVLQRRTKPGRTDISVTTEVHTHTDHPYPPHRSAVSMNRGYGHETEEPKQELDNDSISRKDEEEDIGTFELDFNSSQSRLTDGKGQDGVAL